MKKAYKWKYSEEERPKNKKGIYSANCYDCGAPYKSFPDMVISNELWEKINPTEHKNAGILCPTCIAYRLNEVTEIDQAIEIKVYAGEKRKYNKN